MLLKCTVTTQNNLLHIDIYYRPERGFYFIYFFLLFQSIFILKENTLLITAKSQEVLFSLSFYTYMRIVEPEMVLVYHYVFLLGDVVSLQASEVTYK